MTAHAVTRDVAATVPWDRPFIPKGQSSYSREEIGWHGEGWSGPGNAKLPRGRMRMIDRVTHISDTGGEFGNGFLRAELGITPDLWFFEDHFKDDPVMPGALGLDALWQLLGFYLGWSGGTGLGRALGVGTVKFRGQIWPTHELVTYGVDLIDPPRIGKVSKGIANGWLRVDDPDNEREPIYTVQELDVGLFLPRKVSVPV